MSLRFLTDASGKSFKVVDVGDYLVPRGIEGTTLEQTLANFKHIRNFTCRNDDILLMSYPKTGTNWVYEIVCMLLDRTTEGIKGNKIMSMLEFQPKEIVQKLPAPRVLNTHVNFRYLPKDLKEKQIKTILVLRNPKDTMVSYYNHIKGLRCYGYDGEWKDWFQLYMQGEIQYGMYTDHLKEVEKAMDYGIGFPFYIVYYEDLKLNGLEEVIKLARFLGVEDDKELCKKIVEKCSFDSMAKQEKFPKALRDKLFNEGFSLFRKGQIGDWKNWFTVAESKQFDKYWEKEMEGSKFKFTFSNKQE